MRTSKVTYLSDEIVQVEKENGRSVYVYQYANTTTIFDINEDSVMFLAHKVFMTSGEAYTDFMHKIGKMTKKEEDSIYFTKHHICGARCKMDEANPLPIVKNKILLLAESLKKIKK